MRTSDMEPLSYHDILNSMNDNMKASLDIYLRDAEWELLESEEPVTFRSVVKKFITDVGYNDMFSQLTIDTYTSIVTNDPQLEDFFNKVYLKFMFLEDEKNINVLTTKLDRILTDYRNSHISDQHKSLVPIDVGFEEELLSPILVYTRTPCLMVLLIVSIDPHYHSDLFQ